MKKMSFLQRVKPQKIKAEGADPIEKITGFEGAWSMKPHNESEKEKNINQMRHLMGGDKFMTTIHWEMNLRNGYYEKPKPAKEEE